MDWLKALHIIFLVTWFAGLFYLPRLYVYHASEKNEHTLALFEIMERRLFIIMTIGGVLTIIFGLSILFNYLAYYMALPWMHLKLTLVVALMAYHYACYRVMVNLRTGKNQHSDRWYRLFNEVPGIFLIVIVILVVVMVQSPF